MLERALAHIGKPFRRFPYRYDSVNEFGGFVETDTKEVVLLKLHGSLDWFDKRGFLERKTMMESQGSTRVPRHSVFENPSRYDARPLVDGIPIKIEDFADSILKGLPHPKVWIAFWAGFGHPKIKIAHRGEVNTVQIGESVVYASWFYVVDDLGVNIMYAEPGERRKGLIYAWHPSDFGKYVRIGGALWTPETIGLNSI